MASEDDRRNIESLIFSYAERIDAGDFSGVAELFRHGRIQAAPGVVVEGADAVRKLYENSTRRYDDGTPRTHHVTSNVVVRVDDSATSASAKSYYTVFQQTDGLPLQAIITGHYADTFHVVDGDWCFDERAISVGLTGDLSQHLLFELG